METVGRSARVRDTWRYDLQPHVFEIQCSRCVVERRTKYAFGIRQDCGFRRCDRPAFRQWKLNRRRRRQVQREQGFFGLKQVDVRNELVPPELLRCHFNQVLDVNRRHHAMTSAERVAVGALDTPALAVLGDQSRHRLVRKDGSAVRLDGGAKRGRQHAGSTLWNRAASELMKDRRERGAPGLGVAAWLRGEFSCRQMIGPDVIVLVQLANNVVRRHRVSLSPDRRQCFPVGGPTAKIPDFIDQAQERLGIAA